MHIIKSVFHRILLLALLAAVGIAGFKAGQLVVEAIMNVEEAQQKKTSDAMNLAAALKNVIRYDVLAGGSCSATVITKSLAVTAAHCIPPAPVFMMFAFTQPVPPLRVSKTQAPLMPVLVDTYTDRALLSGDFSTFNPIAVDHLDGRVFTEKEVVVCGFPGENHQLRCSSAKYKGRYIFGAVLENTIIPGQSGGAVFALDGTLVGITQGMTVNVGEMSLNYVGSTVGLVPLQ